MAIRSSAPLSKQSHRPPRDTVGGNVCAKILQSRRTAPYHVMDSRSSQPANHVSPERRTAVPANDGDAERFCLSCAFAEACSVAGYGKAELSELHCLVEHVGPFEPGQHIFRNGDPFRALFAVRSGM